MKQGLWIHQRHVSTPATTTTTPPLPTLTVDTISGTTNIATLPRVPVSSVFQQRDDHIVSRYGSDFSTGLGRCRKPENCAWWSHGRWLFDPYYDSACDEQHIDAVKSETANVALLQTESTQLFAISPSDVDAAKLLTITTDAELLAFEKQYALRARGNGTSHLGYIDWERIRSAGFSGCVFDINRRNPVVFQSAFLYGYDVESLVIWSWDCVRAVVPISSTIEVVARRK
jgi:hypothetical protein